MLRCLLATADRLELTPHRPVRLVTDGRLPRPRLIEISIDGWPPAATSGPTVVLGFDDRWCEYALPFDSSGRITALLAPANGRLRSVHLIGPDDGVVAIERVVLTSIPPFALALRALAHQPGAALAAFYWAGRGKRLRARNRLNRIISARTGQDTAAWMAGRRTAWIAEDRAFAETADHGTLPHIVVLASDPAHAMASPSRGGGTTAQPYPRCRIAQRDGDKLASALVDHALTATDWIVLLETGDRLMPDALWHLAAAARRHPDALMLYGDHVSDDPVLGLRAPVLKPSWDDALFAVEDYVGTVACRRSVFDGNILAHALAPSGGNPCDGFVKDRLMLTLAADAADGAIVRIPRLLTVRDGERMAATTMPTAGGSVRRAAALAPILAGEGLKLIDTVEGRSRILHPMPATPPLVSVIVPTRDHVELLQPCVEGLLRRTDYAPLEIIIADNASTDPQALTYMRSIALDPRVRILPIPGPFNFAAINNAAVEVAQGGVLAFLNNDIEVLHADWLTEMVAPALRPDIGAVGAKLLYPGGKVQHGGVIVGINGLAGHAHRFFEAGHAGYMNRLRTAHRFSAVTAACLVVQREKFLAVGGFDAIEFPVALNDVDLCLKLSRRGYSTLWTPHATLLHKESASRARDTSSSRYAAYQLECRNFQDKWRALIDDDPCYHPELTRTGEDFSLNETVT